MIINIRGASCSGKSTPVYRLLADHQHTAHVEVGGWNIIKPRTIGYSVGDLLIIGPYEPQAKTGGMDMLTPGKVELVTTWIEDRLMSGLWKHVIYESLMCSLAMGRYRDLARRTEAGPCGRTAFAFLNTPLEVREQRIMARNGGLGPSGKGINVEATLHHQHLRMQQIRANFVSNNELVYDIDYLQPYEQILWLLQSNGWDPTAPAPDLSLPGSPRTLVEIGQQAAQGLVSFDDPKRQARLEKELKDHTRALRLPEDMVQCQP